MMNERAETGIIVHSISGFYYVEAAGFVYECKAKGNFRNRGLTPLTGDRVRFEPDGAKGFILEILPRKNELRRPPLANLSRLFIVASADRPKPNLFVIDKLTALAVNRGVEPVIVFSKTDLADVSAYRAIYEKAGFPVVCCSAEKGEGMDALTSLFDDGVNAFTGNSGVGKSSILNALMPDLQLETNEISEKLGISRNTAGVYISNLTKSGYLLGRAYVVNADDYIVGIGAANVDLYGKSSIAIRKHFDHPGKIRSNLGGVSRNVIFLPPAFTV